MAAEGRWCYRGDPQEGHSAPLVQFTNGKLKSTKSMSFTLYKHKDTSNPRKKHRVILNAETDRLSYVGSNFGVGALKCNTLCRYFIGVLDENSRQMDVYNAELFNMQPLVSNNVADDDLSEYLTKSYREKVDLCIETFGTNKQRKALNSRRMNKVGKEVLNKAVTKVAEDVIETKGVTALVSDAAEKDEVSLILPPCHEDADKPEDVYKFEDIISPAEYEALQAPAAAFMSITSADILKMEEEKSHCSFVLNELKSMPLDEKRCDHKARCLWFFDSLVKLSSQKNVKKKYALGPDCPHIISNKLVKTFTALAYANGRIQNQVSASMKVKITAYAIALALHINNFQTDLTVLQRDLKLRDSRILDIARAMRLKITKSKSLFGLEEHKLGTLSLPLPVYKVPPRSRKRKMN
ncbi:DNA-directed RNA polymerase I subunit RPA49 [Varanus komodoensis]|uniref:RNA polymerase I subunit E n=1 Tax=Varanus komodoensis TaxID=61221 RepID=A0A8D2IYP1_VARKO|nr:DNA-directed RNA polymerase I subunit RPA49 [Varanus komodoensis]XP_044295521.1 DNA-directed RNA polymerase I subunit RPA49 [Varanus komodoensis]KAF7241208.1 DNA-directed RNA polymerase I subunit RPA49 [Varanus komodoensis]